MAGSIFAFDLATLLQRYQCTLADLRRKPFVLDGKKIDRLEASLYESTLLPALNHGEIMTIIMQLKLPREERLAIYAALSALGAQRVLGEYLDEERAFAIATEVRDAALAWMRDHGDEADDALARRIRRMRGVEREGEAPTPMPGDDRLFAEALDAYDEGVQWGTLGIHAGHEHEHHYLENAQLALERAEALMRHLPIPPRDTPDWQYWYDEIRKELESVRGELGL